MTPFYIIGACVHSDIIHGTCLPYGASNSLYFTVVAILLEYLLPMITMLFCYSRIVYKMTHKVRLTPMLR